MLNRIYGSEAANYTQPFVNNIIVSLIEKLSDEHYNLLIEGTCRRSDVPLKTCNDLKEKGYSVELDVMCTNADVAWQSTIDRYNKEIETKHNPRIVPFDKYCETVNALPQSIDDLYNSKAFDDILLYTREREVLYRKSETPDESPYEIINGVLFDKNWLENRKSEQEMDRQSKAFWDRYEGVDEDDEDDLEPEM